MTRAEANRILDAAKDGQDVPTYLISQALVATGDAMKRGINYIPFEVTKLQTNHAHFAAALNSMWFKAHRLDGV